MYGTPLFGGEITGLELPHFLKDNGFYYPGNKGLDRALAATAEQAGFRALSHPDPNQSLQYGTLIPMLQMKPESAIPVVPGAANQIAITDEGRRMYEAMARAISTSGHRVGFLARSALSFFSAQWGLRGRHGPDQRGVQPAG